MQKLVPITRLGRFFGGEDYRLDIDMGEEWLHGDINLTPSVTVSPYTSSGFVLYLYTR